MFVCVSVCQKRERSQSTKKEVVPICSSLKKICVLSFFPLFLRFFFFYLSLTFIHPFPLHTTVHTLDMGMPGNAIDDNTLAFLPFQPTTPHSPMPWSSRFLRQCVPSTPFPSTVCACVWWIGGWGVLVWAFV